MATFTPNYNLKKPGQEDYYNVDNSNGNMDIIDAQLKANADAVGNIDVTGTNVTVDQTQVPASPGNGTIQQLFNWIANRIKAITGKTNWWDTPTKSLESLNSDLNTHIGSGGASHAAVTTSVAGFMSAADKTKLNGIETGATADQTPVEIQASITGGASTIAGANLTASRALVSNTSGKVAVAAVTSTELGYLDGVTSAIQPQLNAKLASSAYTAADVLTKLKTVDTDTSGLNANTLQGKTANDLAPYAVPGTALTVWQQLAETLKVPRYEGMHTIFVPYAGRYRVSGSFRLAATLTSNPASVSLVIPAIGATGSAGVVYNKPIVLESLSSLSSSSVAFTFDMPYPVPAGGQIGILLYDYYGNDLYYKDLKVQCNLGEKDSGIGLYTP